MLRGNLAGNTARDCCERRGRDRRKRAGWLWRCDREPVFAWLDGFGLERPGAIKGAHAAKLPLTARTAAIRSAGRKGGGTLWREPAGAGGDAFTLPQAIQLFDGAPAQERHATQRTREHRFSLSVSQG